jgi:hypothetical protein
VTAKTDAEIIAHIFDNDGQQFYAQTSGEGVLSGGVEWEINHGEWLPAELDVIAMNDGAPPDPTGLRDEHDPASQCRRWVFEDGSAILTTPGGWSIEGDGPWVMRDQITLSS